jgi:hypothetical protein
MSGISVIYPTGLDNSILYIEGEKCMNFPKHRGKNEHSLQKYIQGLPELADQNNTVKSLSSGNNRKNI